MEAETDGKAPSGAYVRGDFAEFFVRVEPSLRTALVAALGVERGREATAEALAWAWEHKARLEAIDRPVRYLYRVGVSRTRLRRRRAVFDRPADHEMWFEPRLAEGLERLSKRQRVAVVLSVGHGWTQVEIAELLGVRPTTVQNHVERGLSRLRSFIGGESQ